MHSGATKTKVGGLTFHPRKLYSKGKFHLRTVQRGSRGIALLFL